MQNTPIYSVSDIKLEMLRNMPICKRRKRHAFDVVCAFDIETSRLDDIKQSIIYCWQFQFDSYFTVFGRHIGEFLRLIKMLQMVSKNTKNNPDWIIYVHNLSYEFSFLADFFKFETNNVFCLDSRKPVSAKISGIEFRCSYALSNMSLANFTAKYNVSHAKAVGWLDYNKFRSPITPMSKREMIYCINDVVGLVEALKAEMDFQNLGLLDLPLTSTGYMRRMVKAALRYDRKDIKLLYPDFSTYILLREAFRGGNTHCSRFYTGKILKNVKSMDISSSYPFVLYDKKFPMKPFINEPANMLRVRELLKENKPFIGRFKINNFDLKNFRDGFPYIPLGKCLKHKGDWRDNGRIITAEYVVISLTDIDFKIIEQQYEVGEWECLELKSSVYWWLPEGLIDLIEDIYTQKTELKGVAGREVYYMKFKNLFNSIFGISVQNPGKERWLYGWNKEQQISEFYRENTTIEERLNEYHSERAVMPYQWGVWVTAYARERLQQGLELAGDSAVYCDTDSVKYIDKGVDLNWESLNPARPFKVVDNKGKEHFLGVWEYDGKYNQFVSLGAKKYAYTINHKLYITVSGVNKIAGAKELLRKGGIKAFKPGFIWDSAAGVEVVYNDKIPDDIKWYKCPDGYNALITSNIYMYDSSYTMSMTSEYMQAVQQASDFLNYMFKPY